MATVKITNLSSGTQLITDVYPGVDTTDPTQNPSGTTKKYSLLTLLQLANFRAAVVTTTVLTATYNNTNGTLTNGGAQAAFSADGVSPALNSIILVTGQASSFQNGIYKLTTVGSISTNWVLTRLNTFSTASSIIPGVTVAVYSGSNYGKTLWMQYQTVTTVGTDAINFVQCETAGTGLTKSQNTLSLTVPVAANLGGTGVINSNTITLAGNINTAGAFITSGANSLTLTTTGATNVTLPTSGTLATTSQLPTLPLVLSEGGTSANLTAANGGIVYSTASALAILAPGSTGQIILSQGASAPLWSTATYPATTTINQLLYSSSNNVIAGLATGNNGVLITGGTGIPSISSTLPSTVQANITAVGTITSGTWNGSIIDLAHGGTNANITAADGGLFYSTATSGALLAPNDQENSVLLSHANSAPYWSTTVYPDLVSAGQILYASATNSVSGLATNANSILATDNSGVPALVGSLANGQILIGRTGDRPINATLTAGTGISISNGSGTITINATGSGQTWTEVTGTSQSMAVDNGYIANNVGLVTLVLPTTASLGASFDVVGKGGGGWRISYNTGQSIVYDNLTSTVTTGNVSSDSVHPQSSITLVCTTANTVFTVKSASGFFDVT